jgi:hypothetical protein
MEHLIENKHVLKKVLLVDTFFFLVILTMSLVGIGLTDFKGLSSEAYWRFVFILTAVITTIWSVWKYRKLGIYEGSKILYKQAVVWFSGFVAMGLLYMLLSTGRLNYETTGLLIVLLLALLTFIDGILVSWKLFLIGLTLLFALILSTYVESYLWMILIFTGIVVLGVVLFVVLKIKKLEKNI